MKDPQPLLDGGASRLELELLRAGDADGPSSRAREAALAALGLSAVVLSSSVSAAGVAGGAPTLAPAAPIFAAKWWAIGAFMAASGAGVGYATFAADSEPSSPPPVARNGVSPSGPPVVSEAIAVAAPPEQPSAPSSPSATAGVSDPDSGQVARPPATAGVGIQEQIALIDRARAAAAAGDPAAVLSAVDAYQRRFPKGVLGQEAALLRIEALLSRGDTAKATRLGQQFLELHPRSALAPRLRSQLERNAR